MSLSITRAVQAFWGILNTSDELSRFEPQKILSQLLAVIERNRNTESRDCRYLVGMVDRTTCELSLINHGFSTSIIVKPSLQGNLVRLLDDELINMKKNASQPNDLGIIRSKLEPENSLIFYSDGIGTGSNLRPGTFSRLLQRGLESSVNIGSPRALRDEIVGMLQYYMQRQQIDQRVNFLCLSVSPPKSSSMFDD